MSALQLGDACKALDWCGGRIVVWQTLVTHSPNCLAPVSDDEHEMLDLRTETTGGFAAISHVKIAPLTGVRV